MAHDPESQKARSNDECCASRWQPLEDNYEAYLDQLEEVASKGLLQDPEDARVHGFPPELRLTDEELDELGAFCARRANELPEALRLGRPGLPGGLLQLLLNTTIAAMNWERERIGR